MNAEIRLDTAGLPCPKADCREFCLFELGSTSLKCHFRIVSGGRVRKDKVPWNLGHEILETTLVSPRSMRDAANALRLLLRSHAPHCEPSEIVAFATGVFRSCSNLQDLVAHIREETGLQVKVISADQEAALLKSVFMSRRPRPPALAFDLGGGTLQWFGVDARGRERRASIPAGVIRIYRASLQEHAHFEAAAVRDSVALILGKLRHRIRAPEIIGTGGTVKAICRLLRQRTVARRDLEILEKEVQAGGPPPGLQPHRQPLFGPGVVLVRYLMEQFGAERLSYENLSVGRAMLHKVIPFYTGEPESRRPSKILRGIHYSEIVHANRREFTDTPVRSTGRSRRE